MFSVSLEIGKDHLYRMQWHERLLDATQRRGWSHIELARRAEINEERVYKYFQGKVAQPRGNAIERLAAALGVNFFWLRDGVGPEFSTIPVVGYVGAGEMFIPVPDNHLGDISLEIAGDDPIAVVVRGSSNLPVYRPGDILVCSRSPAVDPDQYLNRDCVLLTAEGLGYVKKVIKGGKPDRWTLLSYNADPIENVEIEWVAPIRWVRRS